MGKAKTEKVGKVKKTEKASKVKKMENVSIVKNTSMGPAECTRRAVLGREKVA